VVSWPGVAGALVAGVLVVGCCLGGTIAVPSAPTVTVNSAVWTAPACWKSRNRLYVPAVGKVVANLISGPPFIPAVASCDGWVCR
jgi:hypothetical protein